MYFQRKKNHENNLCRVFSSTLSILYNQQEKGDMKGFLESYNDKGMQGIAVFAPY